MKRSKLSIRIFISLKEPPNVSDLNLDNANIEAEEWANQQEEELVRMKEMKTTEEKLQEMYHMN